jgi:hypothetical protein
VADKHLWEIEHPYYCNEGNYFASPDKVSDHYDSWADFIAEYGDADFSMNLLFRWDWRKADPEEERHGNPKDELLIFWMGQRKGLYRWTTIDITDADEPAVREFLAPRWTHLQKLWEGIS